NTITLQPGKTRSLLHFVVLGQMVNAASSAGVRAAVETTATALAAAPEIGDLTAGEICSIDNFNVAALTAHGFNFADCTPTTKKKKSLEVAKAAVQKQKKAKTNVKYDVVGKPIGQLRAAMESGVTTSREITEAYPDRTEFYDKGQFGFNAFEIVADDAIEQAE